MEIHELKLTEIVGPAFKIRTEPEDGEIADLMESISTHGLKQPILVRPGKKGYEIVAGLRRTEAVRKLKRKTISAIVENLDDKVAFEIMLAENIQWQSVTFDKDSRMFRECLFHAFKDHDFSAFSVDLE
jgi:ParB family transcriptional regulator, chromosome partitioning protein